MDADWDLHAVIQGLTTVNSNSSFIVVAATNSSTAIVGGRGILDPQPQVPLPPPPPPLTVKVPRPFPAEPGFIGYFGNGKGRDGSLNLINGPFGASNQDLQQLSQPSRPSLKPLQAPQMNNSISTPTTVPPYPDGVTGQQQRQQFQMQHPSPTQFLFQRLQRQQQQQKIRQELQVQKQWQVQQQQQKIQQWSQVQQQQQKIQQWSQVQQQQQIQQRSQVQQQQQKIQQWSQVQQQQQLIQQRSQVQQQQIQQQSQVQQQQNQPQQIFQHFYSQQLHFHQQPQQPKQSHVSFVPDGFVKSTNNTIAAAAAGIVRSQSLERKEKKKASVSASQRQGNKFRRNLVQKVCHVTAEGVSSDVWAWRKYGQKPIKGYPYPRNYYKCSTKIDCQARKYTERNRYDPTKFIFTYTGEHNHPAPTHRNSQAGSTRPKLTTYPCIPPEAYTPAAITASTASSSPSAIAGQRLSCATTPSPGTNNNSKSPNTHGRGYYSRTPTMAEIEDFLLNDVGGNNIEMADLLDMALTAEFYMGSERLFGSGTVDGDSTPAVSV